MNEQQTTPNNVPDIEPIIEQADPTVTESNAEKRSEDRQIVTHFAFGVSDELLGTPLASPLKRGLAMLIDLLLISMLTTVHSVVFASFAAWTFFRAGNRLKTKKRFNAARLTLRFLTAVLLFVIALSLFDTTFKQFNPELKAVADGNSHTTMGASKALIGAAITVKYAVQMQKVQQQISAGECAEVVSCWQPVLTDFANDMAGTDISQQHVYASFDSLFEDGLVIVDSAHQQQLVQHMRDTVKQQRATDTASIPTPVPDVVQQLEHEQQVDIEPTELEKPAFEPAESSRPPGLIAWIKSVAEDLGLGFGWAAFYFSVFTAWWSGQTPGKKLFGIKVVLLNGGELNLWDSFGRYGGYGAGLATGLLGFLQLYWDDNRQAIQDKISETLVIDVRKTKRQWHGR